MTYNFKELTEKFKEADCLTYPSLAKDMVNVVVGCRKRRTGNPYSYDTKDDIFLKLARAYNITEDHLRLYYDSKLAKALR